VNYSEWSTDLLIEQYSVALQAMQPESLSESVAHTHDATDSLNLSVFLGCKAEQLHPITWELQKRGVEISTIPTLQTMVWNS